AQRPRLAARAEGHGLDGHSYRPACKSSAAAGVPQADIAASVPGGEYPAVRAERQAIDGGAFGLGQGGDASAAGDVPQANMAVRVANSERLAVRAERHGVDGEAFGEGSRAAPACGVPEDDIAVRVPGCERQAVRAERHA